MPAEATTKGGPVPAVAYAMRTPSAVEQNPIRCCISCFLTTRFSGHLHTRCGVLQLCGSVRATRPLNWRGVRREAHVGGGVVQCRRTEGLELPGGGKAKVRGIAAERPAPDAAGEEGG